MFISIEGPDGAGKSTQINNIKKFLEDRNIPYILTREPGGTKISEKIRDIILDKENVEMNYVTEALLYAASRAQHVSQVIKPALEEGKVVICDRFIDSSFAYQGYARGLGDTVWDVNRAAVDGCMPDVTFVFNLNPEVGLGRVKTRGEEDRLELEKMAFHRKVYEGYLDLEKKYPDRIVPIDASKSIEDIKKDIYLVLEERICR
ncbi:MAG: dTMP kinase [Clostridia bacterium]|nr:dTMP kinase [Clostridia bacterium]